MPEPTTADATAGITVDTQVPFLAVDIETTSLDERHGHILEIGLALVTPDLDITARASWITGNPRSRIDDMRAGADPTVRDIHDASGLWQASIDVWDAGHRRVTDMAEIHAERWVSTHAHDPRIPLLGSSVHFDRRWLTHHAPRILRNRTHRIVDVSTVRELLDRWAPDIVATRPPAAKRHRVDPDLDDTVAELRHYRTHLGLTPTRV